MLYYAVIRALLYAMLYCTRFYTALYQVMLWPTAVDDVLHNSRCRVKLYEVLRQAILGAVLCCRILYKVRYHTVPVVASCYIRCSIMMY